MRAVAEAVFATEDGAPPAERLDWVCDDLDDFFARCGARSRWVFRLSLLVVGIVAPLLARRARSLGSLSLADRIDALERLERSKLGLALLAVKAMLCVVYYEHPDVTRAYGLDGACKVAP